MSTGPLGECERSHPVQDDQVRDPVSSNTTKQRESCKNLEEGSSKNYLGGLGETQRVAVHTYPYPFIICLFVPRTVRVTRNIQAAHSAPVQPQNCVSILTNSVLNRSVLRVTPFCRCSKEAFGKSHMMS